MATLADAKAARLELAAQFSDDLRISGLGISVGSGTDSYGVRVNVISAQDMPMIPDAVTTDSGASVPVRIVVTGTVRSQ